MSDLPPPPPSPPPPPPDIPGRPPSSQPPGPAGGGTGSKARWATTGAGTTVELAGIKARLAARVLDTVLIFILTAVGARIYFAADLSDALSPATNGLLTALITVAIGALYEVWMIAVKGQTLGKMAVGIDVRRADDGELPGWASSLRRWLLPGLGVASYWVSLSLLYILIGVGDSAYVSLLWAVVPHAFLTGSGVAGFVVYASLLWGRNYQGWHDRVANTLVVRKGRPIVWLIVVISVGGAALLAAIALVFVILLLWLGGI